MSDNHLFWAIPLVPMIGACVAVVVPADDRLTLRAVGMASLVVAALLAAAVVAGIAPSLDIMPVGFGHLVTLTPTSALALMTLSAAAPLALRAGAPRVRAHVAAYVIAVLLQTSLSALAVMLTDVRAAVSCAALSTVPAFAIVALFGGPERGSAAWRATALFILVDMACITALTVPYLPAELRWLCVLGPGLVRLTAGPHGLWALPVFQEAPAAAAAMSAGTGLPLGAALLAKAAPMVSGGEASSVWVMVLAGAVGVGAIIVVVERDLRRMAAHWQGIVGSLAALGIVATNSPVSAAWGVALACQGGLATAFLVMVTEAIERRLESRAVPHLAGLSDAAPLLAVLLPIALLLIAGAPGPGTAVPLWHVLFALAESTVDGAAGTAAWALISIVVAASAAASTAARVVLPLRRRHEGLIRVSFMQGIRLAVPLMVMVAAMVAAPLLVGRVGS